MIINTIDFRMILLYQDEFARVRHGFDEDNDRFC
jgi:hypothetical protein